MVASSESSDPRSGSAACRCRSASKGDPTLTVSNRPKQVERLTFLLQLAQDLERFAPEEQHVLILRHVHRWLGPILGADLGFVWRLGRGYEPEAAYHLAWTPRGRTLQESTMLPPLQEAAIRFARDRKSPDDPHLLLILVEARGRPVGVLAFLRPGRRFGRKDARFGNEAAEILGRQLEHRERERIYQLRERIVRKVLLQLRPADILYQVLHGLKRLLRYDHSASVHTIDRDGRSLATRAEVIAWTKGKSVRIGERTELTRETLEAIDRIGRCVVLDPAHPEPALPAGLLDHLSVLTPDAPPARSLLLACLRQHERPVGLLVIRWLRPGACVASDQETIDSFLHIVSATALHSEFFRLQEDRLREAERRTALGELARAISHDLNNAFGVIQPLLETLRRDTEAGTITTENLVRDLDTLKRYVGTSLRIFQGLLSFARGSVEGTDLVDIGRCLDEVLILLERGLRTDRITVDRQVPTDLPRIYARRHDIEQLILNLITNARESMQEGGSLTIHAWVEDEKDGRNLRISIADTGRGIPVSELARVFEPFFSTKPGGTGLGLDICRSIVWEYDGGFWLESDVGKGTVAQVRLPVRQAPVPSSEEKNERTD